MQPEPFREEPRPIAVVAIRLAFDIVRTCLVHSRFEYRVIVARHVHHSCKRVLRGDVDLLVVRNGDLPFWDVHVLREITRRHGTELVAFDEKRSSETLARTLDEARARRDRYLGRTVGPRATHQAAPHRRLETGGPS